MKTIHFKNCKDCPYKHIQYDFDENGTQIYNICSKHLYTVLLHIDKIPEWCPIPDDNPTNSIIDEIWDKNDDVI